MFVIGVRNNPMKMAKKVEGFWPPFALNTETVQGGVPLLMGFEGGCVLDTNYKYLL